MYFNFNCNTTRIWISVLVWKWKILERSRTALWRLIDATAKSSSSLNTYPIPDFFGPAAMQLQTFSRARKILGIRILPRAPTLQTYLFWPIGVNQRRELAQYSSDSRFFWSSCNATSNIFTCAKKKLDPIWLPEIRLLHLGLSLVMVVCEQQGPLLRRRRRVDRHRFDGERGDERRERLLARRRRRRVHATAGRADVSGAARLPRACQPRCQRRPHPLAHRAASCPSDAAPARPASRGVLSRPASRVGGAPGARGARATRAHARRV